MKVLQVNNFHFIRGGSDRVYFETSKLLESKGHQVVFFSTADPKNQHSIYSKYFVKNFDYYETKNILKKLLYAFRYVYNLKSAKNLKKLIKKEKPDIAHLHIFQSRLSGSILRVFKKFNIPVVMTLHEYKLLCPQYTFINSKNEICEKCKTGKYINAIKYRCNHGSYSSSFVLAFESYFRDLFLNHEKNIDHFIIVSHFSYNKHIEYIPSLSKKSSVLYNFYKSKARETQNHYGNYYLYFGRLSKEKGIFNILKAAAQLRHLDFKIIGTGDIEKELIEYSVKNKLTNVEFLGFKSGKELEELISMSKFVIVPSTWYENNPMVVIESYTYGKPVIGANIGGIPELIDNRKGFLFEYNSYKSLTNSIKLAEEIPHNKYFDMCNDAREFSKTHFNQEDHYRKLLNIYKKTIELKKDDRTIG